MDNLTNSQTPAKGKVSGFWRFMLIYAAIFLGVAFLGFALFWGYMDAYEDSRITSTIESYIESLTPQYVCDRSGDLLDSIDPDLQSRDACEAIILDFLSGDITYARKISECADDRMVYTLRSGGKAIGKVEFEPQGKKRFGFAQWTVSKDSFDLSFLVSGQTTVTVDSTMQVYFGDQLLDEGYITDPKVKYEAVKDYYDEQDLPYKVTYSTGPVLGETNLRVVDAEGKTVEIAKESDLDAYLNNCTEAVHTELDTFIRDFVDRYTRYLASRLDNRQANYNALTPLLLDGSDLKYRISRAYDGLQYGQSKSDTITGFTSNYIIDLGDNKYLCDVTYEVDSLGRDGKLHHSVNNAHIFLVRGSKGLQAERLLSY